MLQEEQRCIRRDKLMITLKAKGSFDKTTKFLGFLFKKDFLKKLDSYGVMGVEALSSATPIDTGETASHWSYKVETGINRVKIYWINDHTTPNGTPIVILLEYGHGTRNGYVSGRDFINPAIQPVFDFISEDIWKEVVNA